MTLSELLETAKTNAGYLVAIAAGIGVLAKWRKAIVNFIASRLHFQRDMRTFVLESNKERRSFMAQYADDSKRWNRASELSEENNKLLRNGIPHSLALLTAKHIQAVEAMSEPLFICDETGRNEAVSLGYLHLIGTDSIQNLESTGWKDIITGPLVQNYLQSFTDAVAYRRRYVASVGFQNPFTREDRGVWRVTADCKGVADALVFTGTFYPEDERANEIAKEYGWPTNPNPQPILPNKN